METILVPCRVPWAISPTASGVTLIHTETDIAPVCEVVFGAGRLSESNKTDLRRVAITFSHCYYTRTGYHDDSVGVDSLGYRIDYPEPLPKISDFLDWRNDRWRSEGICPTPGFFFAESSEWLASLPEQFQQDSQHYVIDGRDGYVEVIARGFEWREWIWKDGLRDDVPSTESIEDQGTSTHN